MAIALAVLVSGTGATRGQNTPVYLDPSRSVSERVEDLVGQMTLDEKVGQMQQILITHVTAQANNRNCGGCFGDPDPAAMQSVLVDNHVGSLLAGGTEMPVGNTGRDWAVAYNTIQSYAIEHSRLHIPLLFGIDAVHGFSHPVDAPLFPHQVGMGATWDQSLTQAAGGVTGRALRATGWLENFAPVQDVYRDNRWGRAYESWSEQPALAGSLGAAYVRGLQGGPNNALQAAATLKHLAGNSQSINGHDRVAGLLPIRYLQDVFLPAYKSGIDAGARMVMVSSSSINGVPATASRYLQTDLLRQRLGFDGVLISDFNDVQALNTAYHIASDDAGAIARAVNAGLDLAMWVDKPEVWQASLLQDVNSGVVSQQRIDDAVRRIVRLKFELGLFDQPLVDVDAAAASVTAGRELALESARESVVLLKNSNNVLPLAADARVLLTGPSADSMVNQLGGWSVSWQGLAGSGHQCCEAPPDQVPSGTTLLKGMLAIAPNTVFTPATDPAGAVAAAANADVIVVAVGERAYAEGLGDDPAPALSADQNSLIGSLLATGKPVILAVITGRPLGLGSTREQQAAAIVVSFQGSTEAGQALAEVLFGVTNPSGKLSVTWPADADARAPYGQAGDFNAGAASPLGDQPKTLDQLPSTAFGAGSGYNPLYTFGFGLSYTSFTVSDLAVSAPANAAMTATFTVANTGNRAGADSVPIFVHQAASDVVVPPHRLVGFARVQLDPGASQQVQVSVPLSALAVTPGDIDAVGAPQVPLGDYILEVPIQVRPNNLFPQNGALTASFALR